MKKETKVLLIILVVIIISASIYFVLKGNQTKQETNISDIDLYDNSIKREPETIENSKRLLIDAMNSKQHFIDKDNNKVLLKNFEIVENQKAEVEKFAFVDFDGDGIQELVIYTTSDYGAYVILHYEENEIYGYVIEIRSLGNLKADGSFIGSNSANSIEYLKMTFDKNNYSIHTKAIYDTTNNVYRINDKNVSLEKITKYNQEWEQKEDIQWNE